MSDPLVAIYERVVPDQRKAQRRSLLNNRWVEFPAAERHARLGQSRFEHSQITDAHRSAGLLHNAVIQLDYFAKREVAH